MPNPLTTEGYVLVGYGWVPNISGTVTSRDHIATYTREDCFDYAEDYRLIRHKITNVVMKVCDDCGKCEVYSQKPLDEQSEDKTKVNLAWCSFRESVDSSSKAVYSDDLSPMQKKMFACSCSAMDKILPLKDFTDFYDGVLRRFGSTMETIGDGLRTMDSELPRTAELTATLEYNNLYLKSFMNLYGDRTEVERRNEILELRYHKADAVSRYNEMTNALKNTRTFNRTLKIAVVALAVSTVLSVIGIVLQMIS